MNQVTSVICNPWGAASDFTSRAASLNYALSPSRVYNDLTHIGWTVTTGAISAANPFNWKVTTYYIADRITKTASQTYGAAKAVGSVVLAIQVYLNDKAIFAVFAATWKDFQEFVDSIPMWFDRVVSILSGDWAISRPTSTATWETLKASNINDKNTNLMIVTEVVKGWAQLCLSVGKTADAMRWVGAKFAVDYCAIAGQIGGAQCFSMASELSLKVVKERTIIGSCILSAISAYLVICNTEDSEKISKKIKVMGAAGTEVEKTIQIRQGIDRTFDWLTLMNEAAKIGLITFAPAYFTIPYALLGLFGSSTGLIRPFFK